MTAIVAARCLDGVVVGADGSATFMTSGNTGPVPTIAQPYSKKVQIIRDHVIVAGSGEIGHLQRYVSVTKKLWDNGEFARKTEIKIGKLISRKSLDDFQETMPMSPPSAIAAFPADGKSCLCELTPPNFQPEVKEVDGLWYVSLGNGQQITDSFLAFLRSTFWEDRAPNVRQGIFTVLWTLMHACEVAPWGIREPIQIAVLEGTGRKIHARMLPDDELIEHRNLVQSATEHLAGFGNTVLGEVGVEAPKFSNPPT